MDNSDVKSLIENEEFKRFVTDFLKECQEKQKTDVKTDCGKPYKHCVDNDKKGKSEPGTGNVSFKIMCIPQNKDVTGLFDRVMGLFQRMGEAQKQADIIVDEIERYLKREILFHFLKISTNEIKNKILFKIEIESSLDIVDDLLDQRNTDH